MSECLVEKIAFVLYYVKDLEKSRDFYENIINLTPGHSSEEYVEYDLKMGGCFSITNNPEFIQVENKLCGNMVLEVKDLDVMSKNLRDKGVKLIFDEAIKSPVCKVNGFYDLDGNVIGLHQLDKKNY